MDADPTHSKVKVSESFSASSSFLPAAAECSCPPSHSLFVSGVFIRWEQSKPAWSHSASCSRRAAAARLDPTEVRLSGAEAARRGNFGRFSPGLPEPDPPDSEAPPPALPPPAPLPHVSLTPPAVNMWTRRHFKHPASRMEDDKWQVSLSYNQDRPTKYLHKP